MDTVEIDLPKRRILKCTKREMTEKVFLKKVFSAILPLQIWHGQILQEDKWDR
jgi:hypothetical protein